MENTMEQTQVGHTILFDKYNTFTTNTNEQIPAHIETNKHTVPEIFKNYEYPVSSWPVLIDEKMTRQLEKLSIRIPQLINEIPALYFENDVKRIADYYFNGDEMLTQFALMSHNKKVQVGCRLDLTLTETGFKILEANIGSSIGGWQVQSFESIIREMHAFLREPEYRNQFESKDIQLIFTNFLIDQILEYVPSVKDEINVFISLSHVADADLRRNSLDFFNELLQKELYKRGLTGQAVSGSMEAIEFSGKGLYLEGKELHSVLILNLNETNIPPILSRAFLMHKIYFPDHLGIAMYGDKRNLSLLRVLAEEGKFEAADNELVLNSIPWTSFVADKKVTFKQEEYKLLELLKYCKDEIVIKAANGYQGKDVFVGKFMNDQEWEEAINLAESSQAFIAQEFCDSLDFLAPDQFNCWSPHKLIWGSFGFGDEYGGVWVRMSAIKTDVGVINSATGAVEAIVYEHTSG